MNKLRFLTVLFVLAIFSLFFKASPIQAVSPQEACTNFGLACKQSCKVCTAYNKCTAITGITAVPEGAPPAGNCPYCLTDADCTDNNYCSGGVPGFPHALWGTVKICGQNPPAGTQIVAKVCNGPTFISYVNEIKTDPAYGLNNDYIYAIQVNGDIQCSIIKQGGVNGDPLNFWIGGRPAKEWTWFQYGGFTRLDLTTCPSSPTPTLPPRPPVCNLISQEAGSLKYTFNNEWKHYVSFLSLYSGNLSKVAIKAGNWGNAQRSLTCRITNNSGIPISAERSSASFTASSGTLWREIDYKSAPISLQKGLTYRLYCKGPDSWGSLYWIYNQQGNPQSKTFRITLCVN